MSQPKFIVRMRGGYALKFHSNTVAANMYSAVVDVEATRFDSVEEAGAKAVRAGMRRGVSFVVEELR